MSYTTVGDGTWGGTGVWPDDESPGPGHDVVIAHNVTVDSAIVAGTDYLTITVNAGKTLTVATGGSIDNATGTITINGTIVSNVAQTVAGAVAGTGTWQFTQNVTIANDSTHAATLTYQFGPVTGDRTLTLGTTFSAMLPNIVWQSVAPWTAWKWTINKALSCKSWFAKYASRYDAGTNNITVYGDIYQDTLSAAVCGQLIQAASGKVNTCYGGRVSMYLASAADVVSTITYRNDYGAAGNVANGDCICSAMRVGPGTLTHDVTAEQDASEHLAAVQLFPASGTTWWQQDAGARISFRWLWVHLEGGNFTLANNITLTDSCTGYLDNYGKRYTMLVMAHGGNRILTLSGNVSVPTLAVYSASDNYISNVNVTGNLVVTGGVKVGSASSSEPTSAGHLYTTSNGTVRLSGFWCWGYTAYNTGGILTLPPGVAVTSLVWSDDGDYDHHKASTAGGSGGFGFSF